MGGGCFGGGGKYKKRVFFGGWGGFWGWVFFGIRASDNTIVVYPKNNDFDVLFLSYFLRELNLHRWAGGAVLGASYSQTVLEAR